MNLHQSNINKVIDSFVNLPLNDKEYIFDIIRKQILEEQRNEIAIRAKQARINYKNKKVKKGHLKELFKDLEGD